MKKTTKLFTKLAPVILAVAFSAVSMNAMAYGPERQTFTMAEPADYVTFNSITDNPVLGDERNFVRISEADTTNTFEDEVKLQPGKTYEVYIGYHNNAKSRLNQTGVGIARGAKVAVQYPTVVTPAEKGTISAIISAVNANPEEVWDEAFVTSDTDITLNYEVGSARVYNDWGTNGAILSTALFSEEGTYLGLNELNGLLPGCAEYSGHIIIRFKANTTEATVDKTASLDGENFSKEISAKPGDEVTFKVTFKNTGTTDLTNVTLHDELPEGLTLINGTTYLKYSEEASANLMTDLIASNGYNTGTYGPGTSATITYKVKVSSSQDFCGSLVNKIFVDHDNGEITDGAVIKVEGDNCEAPVYNCETDPTLPECQTPDCTTDPSLPGCEKNCKTNPEMEGCGELPNTGPVEIAIAIVIILGIGGGGYYLYRTHRALKTVEDSVSGKDNKPDSSNPTDTPSQKPDNMIK